jgi:aspartate aminotransferase-like enzyme
MLLLIPGPTPIPDPVRAALAGAAVAHRSPGFEALMRSCCDDLRAIFRTRGPVLPVTGSGTTAVESAILSSVDPRNPGTVVACHSGKFGERWGDVAERLRALVPALEVVRVEAPWGEPVAPEALARALRQHPNTTVITCVHSETSTGCASDLEALARTAREHAPDALLIADCITSVGAMPLEQEAWGVDIAIGASQKAFMLPPGLGFVSVGARAVERFKERDHCAPLTMDLRAWLRVAETGQAPFTPPTNLVAGLRAALDLMLAEGVEAIWSRTRAHAAATRGALEAAGIEVAAALPSDALTCIRLPEGVGDEVRTVMRERDGVWLAGGQGPWKGRVVRISHMGAVTGGDTVRGVESLLRALAERSSIDAEAGVRAIHEALGAEANPA